MMQPIASIVATVLLLAFQPEPGLCWVSNHRLVLRSVGRSSSLSTSQPFHKRMRQAPVLRAFQRKRPDPMVTQGELREVEKQVLASARAKLDYESIVRALDGASEDERERRLVSLVALPDDAVTGPSWQVALASSAAVSIGSYILWINATISALLGAIVFFVALSDPTDDDSLAGALARMLGRATLQSYQASRPKVKALARAVLTGEAEIVALREHVARLERDRHELELWKRRRIYVDDRSNQYSLEMLKDIARKNGIRVGGTKSQLLMRLLEAKVLNIAYEDWHYFAMEKEDGRGFPVD